jgi:hypothetical protein
MKKSFVFAASLFLLGFILKFFHVHYNAIVMMVAILLMLVIFTIAIFKKTEGLNPIVGFALTSWLVLLLITIKYFPFAMIVLSIACVLTLIAIFAAFNTVNSRQFVLLGMGILLTMTFYLMPTDSRYYLLSIRWNQEISSDYYSYDKYAWFLYQNEHYAEAIEASEMAQTIAEQSGDQRWIDLIAQHQVQIKQKIWTKYH